MSAFKFTDAMTLVSNNLWAYTSAIGAGICFLVLLVIAGVALHPVSRPFLDRVSFRLLIWALATNTIFGIANTIGGLMIKPGFLCGFAVFVLQFTLELSCFLTFAIALNMQLVVVHHLDGRKFEKFYIIISFVLAAGLTVPPYALKQYGWDPLVEDCWYANDNKKERLGWQIGTQLFWTVLTVIGELLCSSIVLFYMLRYQILYKRSMLSMSRRSNFTDSGSTGSKQRAANVAAPYRGVILRIGLYPIASCIVNATSVACVINATVNDGVHSWNGYRVLLLSDFLYGFRAVVYGLLAATDPSLVKAIKQLWAYHFKKDDAFEDKLTSIGSPRSFTASRSMPLQIELNTITETTREADYLPTSRASGLPFYKHDGPGTPPILKGGDSFVHMGYGDNEQVPGKSEYGGDPSNRSRTNIVHDTIGRRQAEAAARDAALDAFSRQI